MSVSRMKWLQPRAWRVISVWGQIHHRTACRGSHSSGTEYLLELSLVTSCRAMIKLKHLRQRQRDHPQYRDQFAKKVKAQLPNTGVGSRKPQLSSVVEEHRRLDGPS